MKTQISIFDDKKEIRLSHLPDYDKPFELTDENMQKSYFSEEQLKELQNMIAEILQHLHKRDY